MAKSKQTPVKKIPAAKLPAPKVETPVVEIEITADDLDTNPGLEEQGVKVGDIVEVPLEEMEAITEEEQNIHEAMGPYLETYPEVKKFFITTDGQVFLASNEQDAKNHQNSLDKKQDMYTYHVR